MRFIKKKIEEKKLKVLYVHRTYHERLCVSVNVCVCVKGLLGFSGIERTYALCVVYNVCDQLCLLWICFLPWFFLFTSLFHPNCIMFGCITQCCERHLPPHKTKPNQDVCECSGSNAMEHRANQRIQSKCDLKYDMRPFDDLFREHLHAHVSFFSFSLFSHFSLSLSVVDSLSECLDYSVATQCLFLVGSVWLSVFVSSLNNLYGVAKSPSEYKQTNKTHREKTNWGGIGRSEG